MLMLSISAVRVVRSLTGISNWWLWISTKGNFAFLMGCSGTTKVEVGLYSSKGMMF